MSKTERIAEYIASLNLDAGRHDPRYVGYFACFARGAYYEAHDVLEDLWLLERGPDRDFYKGLIQLAGAFVHMQKQLARPDHPKDGRRLHPAMRLLALARKNLAPFTPWHLGLRVDALCGQCAEIERMIAAGGFAKNPLGDEGRAPIDIVLLFDG